MLAILRPKMHLQFSSQWQYTIMWDKHLQS